MVAGFPGDRKLGPGVVTVLLGGNRPKSVASQRVRRQFTQELEKIIGDDAVLALPTGTVRLRSQRNLSRTLQAYREQALRPALASVLSRSATNHITPWGRCRARPFLWHFFHRTGFAAATGADRPQNIIGKRGQTMDTLTRMRAFIDVSRRKRSFRRSAKNRAFQPHSFSNMCAN